MFILSFFLNSINIVDNVMQAIINLQKAIVKVSVEERNRIKIAAVPKNIPAVTPSINASLLVLDCIRLPFSCVSMRNAIRTSALASPIKNIILDDFWTVVNLF